MSAEPVAWSRPWLWLWGLVALTLLAGIFLVSFFRWSIAAGVGFGTLETIGLLHPNDAYPPLTHAIRRYVPRDLAFLAIYGFTGAAGAVWLRLPEHPAKWAALLGLLGWFTTHFDVTFDEKKSQEEASKYRMLGRGAAQVLRIGRK